MRVIRRHWCDRRNGRPHEIARLVEDDGLKVLVNIHVQHSGGVQAKWFAHTPDEVAGIGALGVTAYCECGRSYSLNLADLFRDEPAHRTRVTFDEIPGVSRLRMPRDMK